MGKINFTILFLSILSIFTWIAFLDSSLRNSDIYIPNGMFAPLIIGALTGVIISILCISKFLIEIVDLVFAHQNQRISILHLEPDEEIRFSLSHHLKDKFENISVFPLASLKEAKRVLGFMQFDIIIIGVDHTNKKECDEYLKYLTEISKSKESSVFTILLASDIDTPQGDYGIRIDMQDRDNLDILDEAIELTIEATLGVK